MATMKKSVIITKPASLTGPIKQTTITTPLAKKSLKPDTVVRKTSIAAPKTTPLTNKTPSKPVVSKMASAKVLAATVDKSTVSLKSTPVKLSVSSPSKPVLEKASVKRAVADSTSSDKESATSPVRKLSIPTATKSTKVVTKPVASRLTPGAKAPTVKTKSALIDKSPAKLVAEKLPAKAKPTISTPSKTSSALTKPVTASTLAKRPLTPKTADIKKAVISRPVLAKSVPKTATSVVKAPSTRTPIAAKKVVKKCTEVQICDADSTSLTVNDQELELAFGSVVPKETSVEFNEIQAYKVAEQMMEALGTAAVINKAVQQDSLLKDSVVIDMSALDVASQPVQDEELAAMSVKAKVLEQTTDYEPAKDDDSPKETGKESTTPDLISFVEVAKEEELANGEPIAEDTSEEVAENIAVKDVFDEIIAESAHNQNEDMEPLIETQVDESDEVPSDEAAVVSGDESEPTKKMTSGEPILEPSMEDKIQEVKNCQEFVDDVEKSNSQCDLTSENEVEDENIYDYESCSIEAEVNNKNVKTKEQAEVIDEMLSTAEITDESDEDSASSKESLPEQPEEMSGKDTDPTISLDIQDDYFCVYFNPAFVNINVECNGDDFVVVKMGEENGAEDLEQVPLIVDDCSATDAEKSADTESVVSADSAVSYADVVKQPTTECAGIFEATENEEAPNDLEVEENENTCQQIVHNRDNLSDVTGVNEEEVAVTEAAEDTGATEAAGDAVATEAAGDSVATEAPENSEACADVEENSVKEQIVKVEPLLGPITDEVQQELDAGMEHSHTADEEGYTKVQKKRNKRHNKRHKKSLKALQKENTDFEPVTQVQETQDDLQVFQKQKNYRRAKNSMKRQNRRYSEPYSNYHCYSTPVWKSYYVEH